MHYHCTQPCMQVVELMLYSIHNRYLSLFCSIMDWGSTKVVPVVNRPSVVQDPFQALHLWNGMKTRDINKCTMTSFYWYGSLLCPTSGGQTRNPEAAVQRTIHLERSSSFSLLKCLLACILHTAAPYVHLANSCPLEGEARRPETIFS